MVCDVGGPDLCCYLLVFLLLLSFANIIVLSEWDG